MYPNFLLIAGIYFKHMNIDQITNKNCLSAADWPEALIWNISNGIREGVIKMKCCVKNIEICQHKLFVLRLGFQISLLNMSHYFPRSVVFVVYLIHIETSLVHPIYYFKLKLLYEQI